MAALRDLPPLAVAPNVWVEFIKWPLWKPAIDTLFFVDSVLDGCSEPKQLLPAFKCPFCVEDVFFHSNKALDMHQRTSHACRSELRLFAGANAVCQACQTKFSTRLRLLAHLGDTRRPKCSEWLQQHGTMLTESEVLRLDAIDKKARQVARKAGLTNVPSAAPAVNAKGFAVGRVRAR